MNMKQLQTTQKVIGDATFYIRPFPAFTGARISGELTSLLAPVLGGLGAIADQFKGTNLNTENGKVDIMNLDIDKALPALADSVSTLSGDKLERIMKNLLVNNQNISVVCAATGGNAQTLDMDLANEVFCGDLQDMFILCYEVIKVNYGSFFTKLGTRFGPLLAALKKAPTSPSTEPLTSPVSAS